MAPLIVHGVGDDELFIGDDGVKRPYAMIYPHQEGHHRRRGVAETGSFGRSSRRSRSRTATPATGAGIGGARREDATIASAEPLFNGWIARQAVNAAAAAAAVAAAAAAAAASTDSAVPPSAPSVAQDLAVMDVDYDYDYDYPEGPAAAAAVQARRFTNQPQQHHHHHHHQPVHHPVEVVLRGYRSGQQQYAALNHYEQLAGRILEDYPRQPSAESRRYRSELRDRAMTAARRLTPEQLGCVNRTASGEHWVKVTFESGDAAERALYASPQTVLGHLVHAEMWTGSPPTRDEPILAPDGRLAGLAAFAQAGRSRSAPVLPGTTRVESFGTRGGPRRTATTTAAAAAAGEGFSPPDSRVSSSSATLDTRTISTTTTTMTSGTVTGLLDGWPEPYPSFHQPLPPLPSPPPPSSSILLPAATNPGAVVPAAGQGTDGGGGSGGGGGGEGAGLYCRHIPTARRVRLLPAESALLPRPTWIQWAISFIPFLHWFSGSMIGNEVPRTEAGDFDWARASLYWKFICWLDLTFRLFGGEVVSAADKEE